MRILHVAPGMTPAEDSDRARYVWRLAEQHAALQSAAIFTSVADPASPAGRTVVERRDGVTICWINVPQVSWRPLEASYMSDVVEDAFRQFSHEMRSDVVHIHGFENLSVGLVDILRSKDIRTVFTPHSYWESCPVKSRRCRNDGVVCTTVETSKCGACIYGSGWDELLEAEEQDRHAARIEKSWSTVYRGLYEERYGRTQGRFARRPRAKLFALRKLGVELRRRARAQVDEMIGDPVERRMHRIGQRLRGIDLIAAPSRFMKDDLVRHFGISPNKIMLRPLASPSSISDSGNVAAGSGQRLGYWGPVDDDPGLCQLVESCCDLLARGRDLELHLFGRVSSEKVAGWIAARFGDCGHPSRLIMHASQQAMTLAESMRCVDLVVEPRTSFSVPTAAMQHAAEAGIPLLVAGHSGLAEFVGDHGYGVAYSTEDGTELTRELGAFCSASSEDLDRLRGARPRLRTIEHEALDYVRIYHELLYKKLQIGSEEAQGLTPETWK
jgi:glycosyltransferase involved in cell wall biosynthesis